MSLLLLTVTLWGVSNKHCLLPLLVFSDFTCMCIDMSLLLLTVTLRGYLISIAYCLFFHFCSHFPQSSAQRESTSSPLVSVNRVPRARTKTVNPRTSLVPVQHAPMATRHPGLGQPQWINVIFVSMEDQICRVFCVN